MGNGIGIGSERSRFARGALLLCVRKLEALMHRLLAVAVAVALVIGSGLLTVGVAVASGASPVAGYTDRVADDAFFEFVRSNGHISHVWVERSQRPAGAIAALVPSLGTHIKQYGNSPAFRQRWETFAKGRQPEMPQKATLAELRAKEKARLAEQDRSYQEAMANVKKLPADQQAQMRAIFENARKQMASMPQTSDSMLMQIADSEYRSAKSRYDNQLASAPDMDVRVAIRKALEQALASTAGVDYSAKLAGRRFANPEYEAKDKDWKMAYRGGHDATEAARRFAQGWIAELK